MISAESVIDKICEKGGQHFFYKYLDKKARPYTILQRQEEMTAAAKLISFKGELGEYTKNGNISGLKIFPS